MVSTLMSLLVGVLACAAAVNAVKVGDVIPSGLDFHQGFPPKSVDFADYIAGKTVIVVGLPGAFTPT